MMDLHRKFDTAIRDTVDEWKKRNEVNSISETKPKRRQLTHHFDARETGGNFDGEEMEVI